jgi:tryptophanase
MPSACSSFMVDELVKRGLPVITPAGGLGCHIDAVRFVDHIPQNQYPAGALAAALYITGGIRGMERGTLSEQRNPDGSEPLASMELVRLALPRRVFTLSQVMFAVDRLEWLYKHRRLIGGLQWTEEPEILRWAAAAAEQRCGLGFGVCLLVLVWWGKGSIQGGANAWGAWRLCCIQATASGIGPHLLGLAGRTVA